MKSIHIAYMAIAFSCACNRKIHPASTLPSAANTAQIEDAVLLGVHHKEDLQQPPYGDWFNKNYAGYSIDSAVALQLKPLLKNKKIEIYMGTWCGDSRREVPRIYRILEFAGVHASQVKLVMVDNRDSTYKQSPGHEERGKNIHRVPDLLLYENGKELNRIVEHPVVSLEKDLLKIAREEMYDPAYAGAYYLGRILTNADAPDKNKLADTLKKLVQNSAELNSLGYVWMKAGEYRKAQTAFEINTLLYPGVVYSYDRLAEINFKLNNRADAKKYYQKVLQLQPGNANATRMLQLLE